MDHSVPNSASQICQNMLLLCLAMSCVNILCYICHVCAQSCPQSQAEARAAAAKDAEAKQSPQASKAKTEDQAQPSVLRFCDFMLAMPKWIQLHPTPIFSFPSMSIYVYN